MHYYQQIFYGQFNSINKKKKKEKLIEIEMN